MDERICQGCGAKMQSTHQDAKGYVLEEQAHKNYCRRCFRIRQYSEFQVIDINNSELYEMISNFVAKKNPILMMIDITDIDGSALFDVAHLFKNYPITIIVNKIDVISKDHRRFDIWDKQIEQSCKKHNILIQDIFFVSSKDILGIQRVVDYLEYNFKNQDIRIIGSANVGKSSFVQALIDEEVVKSNELQQTPLVFSTPGTTLGILEIPCKQFTIYDTPGVMQPKQLTYHITQKMLKFVTFNKMVRPRNYPIYEDQQYFIGGYACITAKTEVTNSLTFFFNPMLPIHRRKPIDSDEFYRTHVGELLAPPFKEDIKELPSLLEWETHTFEIERDKTDIVISGLGWISVNQSDITITVQTIKGVLVYTKNALL